ncbi:MAG: hypothetical protein ACP5Q3_10180 [bacterium]
MKKTVFGAIILTLVLFTITGAGEFKLYPGAKLDEKATKEAQDMAAAAKMSNVKASIYTTADSFAKVASFYKGLAKEYTMPRASGTSGKPKKYEKYDLWEAFFIFDGAKDLSTSKLWIKVQRPYIGEEVRDVTAIVLSEKK